MVHITIPLDDALVSVTEEAAQTAGYATTEEYLTDLIARNSERFVARKKGLEDLNQQILDGVNSGLGRPVDDRLFAELSAIADGKPAD